MSINVELIDALPALPAESEEVYFSRVEHSEIKKKFDQLSARVKVLEVDKPAPSASKAQPKWVVIPVIVGVVTLFMGVLGAIGTFTWFFASGGMSMKSDIATMRSQISSLADDVRLLKDHAMKSQLKLGTDVLGANPVAGSKHISDVVTVAKHEKMEVNAP